MSHKSIPPQATKITEALEKLIPGFGFVLIMYDPNAKEAVYNTSTCTNLTTKSAIELAEKAIKGIKSNIN